MKQFTIVRNGVIRGNHRKSAHKCGFSKTRRYPYRVTIDVHGKLRGPDYFVVANEEIDKCVQECFSGVPSMSCERMCDKILDGCRKLMRQYPQWTVEKIHAELTGTNGLAVLSATWKVV